MCSVATQQASHALVYSLSLCRGTDSVAVDYNTQSAPRDGGVGVAVNYNTQSAPRAGVFYYFFFLSLTMFTIFLSLIQIMLKTYFSRYNVINHITL